MPNEEFIETQADFVRREIERRLASFEARRVYNRKRAFVLRICWTTLGSATTILLGMQMFNTAAPVLVRDLAFGLSAIATLTASFEALFGYRELWIRYTTVTTELRALAAELRFALLGEKAGLGPVDVGVFFRRYQAILETANESWRSVQSHSGRSTDDSQAATGTPQAEPGTG